MAYKYRRIGGAWDGEYGISGSIDLEKVQDLGPNFKFYLFTVKEKKSDKSPNYNVMVKDPSFVPESEAPF